MGAMALLCRLLRRRCQSSVLVRQPRIRPPRPPGMVLGLLYRCWYPQSGHTPIVSAVMLLGVIVADLVYAICESFYLSVPECLSNLYAFHALSQPRRMAVIEVVFLALFVTSCVLALRKVTIRDGDHWRTAACLAVFTLAILSADFLSITRATGHFPSPLSPHIESDAITVRMLRNPRFARISMIRLVRLELAAEGRALAENGTRTPPAPVPSAAARAIQSFSLGCS